MRKSALVPLFFLLWPSALFAHRPDIDMTHISLKADGDALRVRVEVTAVPWMIEVSGKVDEDPWPEEARRISAEYLAKNLVFSVDGKALPGRLVRARYVRDPWMGDYSALFAFDLLVPLPSTGTTFTARNQILLENWEENEGATPVHTPVPGRDWRTRFRWSFLPGAARTTTITAPEFSLPLGDLRRRAWEPFLESVSMGFISLISLGGAMALFLSATFFPPSMGARRTGLAAAVLASVLGAACPNPLGERALWGAVSLLTLTSVPRWRPAAWGAGLVLGAAAAARLLAAEGAAVPAATAFSFFFSPWAFAAGVAAPLLCAGPLRRAGAFLHRRVFLYLSPQEYQRQALFHRSLISRFLAVAGLYWVLSPLWSA